MDQISEPSRPEIKNPSKSGVITLFGRPNSGKSTALNKLLGDPLAIVTPKAQTTRDAILGILTQSEVQEPFQILFFDTPGIHRFRRAGLNERMVSVAREAIREPDLIWYMVDIESTVRFEEVALSALKESRQKFFLIFNKIDLVKNPESKKKFSELRAQIEKRISELDMQAQETFEISAENSLGLVELLQASQALLPQGPFLYPVDDCLSDRPTRFFVAENIRKQLYLQLGEELPYSCAVLIDRYQEASGERKKIEIDATLFVERDSQKGMVIGKKGQKIKSIGQEARKEIEIFLDHPIVLKLRVKVLKDWSRDSESLKRLGYPLSGKKNPSATRTELRCSL